MIWNYLYKSTLFRSELKHWLLLLSLLVWSLFATTVALTKSREVIVISLDSEGAARTVSEKNDLIFKKELVSFIRYFLEQYYNYSDKDYLLKMNEATELMSEELWLYKKEDLQKTANDLKAVPLIQEARLLSIDLLESHNVEAELELSITTRLQTVKTKLKVELEISEKERSLKNPWGYQIKGLKDVVL